MNDAKEEARKHQPNCDLRVDPRPSRAVASVEVAHLGAPPGEVEQMRRLTEIKRLLLAISAHADLAERLRLVLSVPSIGERTALALLIRMPELGTLTRGQAASLAGLAPHVQQSGKWQGQARIGGGRSRLRRSLFAAAFAGAHHWNQALIQLHDRLRARGAAHTSAVVACARKLLLQVNAVVARGTPWQDRPPKAA